MASRTDSSVRFPKWGGVRPGAGRKPEMEDSVGLTIHVPAKVANALRLEAKDQEVSISKHSRDILQAARPDLPWA